MRKIKALLARINEYDGTYVILKIKFKKVDFYSVIVIRLTSRTASDCANLILNVNSALSSY